VLGLDRRHDPHRRRRRDPRCAGPKRCVARAGRTARQSGTIRH
jgi:hypothetical protein